MNIFNDPSDRSTGTQDQFGTRVAARLEEGARHLPHDISERLRAARMRALAHRRVVEVQLAPAFSGAQVGGHHAQVNEPGFWTRASAFLPLAALLVGLVGIGALQDQERAFELAEVDAEILTSELPPTAFTDPGFLQFLKKAAQE